MGRQTGVIVFAFATVHVAFIVSSVCLSTSYWLKADYTETGNRSDVINASHSNHSVAHWNFSSHFTFYKGLWEFCQENETTVTVNNSTAKNKTMSVKKYHHKVCSRSGVEKNFTFSAQNTTEVDKVLFKVTQVLYTAGTGFLAVSLVLMYTVFLSSTCRRSLCTSSVMAAFLFLAGLLMLVSLVIFGEHYHNDPDFSQLYHSPEPYDVRLAWSFYTGVAANVLVFVTAIACTYNLVLVRSTEVPYEDLYVST